MDFRFNYCYSKFCLSPSLLIYVALQKPSIYRKRNFQPHDLSEKNAVNCFHSAHQWMSQATDSWSNANPFVIGSLSVIKKSGLECLEWDFKAVSSSCFISCQKLSHFSEIGAIRWLIHLLQRLSAQSRDFYRPLISKQESVFCWCSQLVYG